MQIQMTGERQDYDAYERRAVAGILNRLSTPMTNLLFRHGEGPQPVVTKSVDLQTMHALQGRGLITFDGRKTHRQTQATTLGRKVIAVMLAQEADALMETESA